MKPFGINHSRTMVKEITTEDTEEARRAQRPSDAVFQPRNVEIDQETKPPTAELQIRKDLSKMDIMQRVDSLYFHNHPLFHEKIDSIPQFHAVTFVHNGQGYLMTHLEPLKLHFFPECGFIR